MKILEMEQGSHEWHQARLGLPTASKIHILFTPTGKQSANATRRKYALELAIEKLTKIPTFVPVSFSMQRGTELEPQARIRYHLDTGRIVKQVGFVLHDSGLTGASPDGLVGEDGGVEIKCFEMPHYSQLILSGEVEHKVYMQCQHCMYVTGRKWWDFVLFTDVEPFSSKCHIQRIYRDEDLCTQIGEAVADFALEVEGYTKELIEKAGLTEDMLMFDPPVFNDNETVDFGMSDNEGGE